MSEIYCISYSDFGYLLTEKDWSIKIQKLKDYDFEVYEDLLTADDITLKRRFLGSVPDLFENSSDFKSEPELPYDVERFLMTYHGVEVMVLGSYDFDRLFKDKEKDSLGRQRACYLQSILIRGSSRGCGSISLKRYGFEQYRASFQILKGSLKEHPRSREQSL